MQISVFNFKSIKHLEDFELKPFTIVVGSNNSGKSSLLQLILMIKETLERASTTTALVQNGSPLKELIFAHDESNKLGISFLIDKAEFADAQFFANYGIAKRSAATVKIDVCFQIFEERISISDFAISFDASDIPELEKPFLRISEGPNYKVETNVNNFGRGLKGVLGQPKMVDALRFESIFPLEYRLSPVEDDEIVPILQTFSLPPVKEFLTDYFSRISYIGSYRDPPKESWAIAKSQTRAGDHGEYTAKVLHDRQNDAISYFKLVGVNGERDAFELSSGTVLEAVRYWICENFEICKAIYAIENAGVYQIFLEGELGIKTTINNVGFGVSQILPIVVEGLTVQDGGFLIIEEPESHLHPKLQSRLFDFLYSLVLSGKSVLIETHSDHLIARLQRRVAEDDSGRLVKWINFSSVVSNGAAEYKAIQIDEFGITEHFPEDFIELSNQELSDLVDAQMSKRLRLLNEG